jgi:hypothetical protein
MQAFELVFLKYMVANVTERNSIPTVGSVFAHRASDRLSCANAKHLIFGQNGHLAILIYSSACCFGSLLRFGISCISQNHVLGGERWVQVFYFAVLAQKCIAS